jgi:hypothetical protein
MGRQLHEFIEQLLGRSVEQLRRSQ